MPLTWPTWTDDDGTGTTGTILNNAQHAADATAINNAFIWTAVAFSAGDFTGNGAMTWTVASGDVITNAYIKIGRTMMWSVHLDTTTVGGTPNSSLRLTIPGGFTAAGAQSVKCSITIDNNVVSQAHATTSGTLVEVIRDDFANWTASANLTYVYFTIIFQTTA